MKDKITVNTVKTTEDLIKQYEYRADYSVAFVEELNAYAVAIAYEASQSVFIGHSAIKSGGALKNVLIPSDNFDYAQYYVYVAHNKEMEIYTFFGDMFDLGGRIFNFDFENKAVNSLSIDDGLIAEAYKFVQKQITLCTL